MDYQAGDRVPTEVVEIATCEVPGDWRFGAPARAWKDGVTWRIRPQSGFEGSAFNINGRNGINFPSGEALVVVTGISKGCTIDGRLIDVRNED